jgi:hypothetical protein
MGTVLVFPAPRGSLSAPRQLEKGFAEGSMRSGWRVGRPWLGAASTNTFNAAASAVGQAKPWRIAGSETLGESSLNSGACLSCCWLMIVRSRREEPSPEVIRCNPRARLFDPSVRPDGVARDIRGHCQLDGRWPREERDALVPPRTPDPALASKGSEAAFTKALGLLWRAPPRAKAKGQSPASSDELFTATAASREPTRCSNYVIT